MPISLRILAVAGLGLAFVACEVVGSVQRPAAGGVYREGVVGQPISLNPLLDPLDPVTGDIARLVFAGLVRITDAGAVEPDLADRWTTSEDGRSYLFHLRDGATWQDGSPVTVDDVLTTVAIVQSPDYQGPSELGALWRRVRAESLSPSTLRFELDEPYSSFIEASSLPLLPGHVFSPGQAGSLRDHPGSYAPVGAGPFRVQEVTPQGVRLLRHSGYQGPRPYFDEIDLVFFADVPSAALALRSGEVDGLAGLRPDQAASIAGGGGYLAQSVPILAQQVVLVLNQRNVILADHAVRQAISAGIDRGEAIARALPGEAVPAYGPVPTYSWAYAPFVAVDPRPADARAWLDRAGWRGPGPRFQGLRPLRLELAVPLDARMVSLAQEIQTQLQTFGVQVDLAPTDELDLYRERLVPRTFEMALIGVALGSVDPDPYALWHSSRARTGLNFASYSSPEADRLIEKARLDGDPERRRGALAAFQQLWLDDVPSVVVANPVMTYVVADRIRGVRVGVVPDPRARLQHVAEWYVQTQKAPALFG